MSLVIKRDGDRREAGENQHWFRFVTPRKDEHGTVIIPSGGRFERFSSNPLVLWMHKSRPKPEIDPHTPEFQHVIGRVAELNIGEYESFALVEFDVEDDYARALMGKVKRDFIRMCSMGFKPLRIEMMTPPDELTARRWGVSPEAQVPVVLEWDMVELSIVTIGSNQEALAVRTIEEGVQISTPSIEDIDDTEERAAKKDKPKKQDKKKKQYDPNEGEEDPDEQDPNNREPGDHGDGSDDEEEDRSIDDAGKAVKHAPFPMDEGDSWDADAEREEWAKQCGGSIKGFDKVDKKKYSQMFAIVLGDGESASDYKLPHHTNVDGKLHVSRKGVAAALGALHGARGGLHAPGKLKEAAEAHLQKEQAIIDAYDAKKKERVIPPLPDDLPSPATHERMPMSMKMTPEHRWTCRGLIGSYMNGAAGHMSAMSATKDEGLLNFHKGCAENCMTRAMECARYLRESDGDGEEMRYAPLTAVRTVAESIGTTELRAKFAEVAAETQKYDMATFEDTARASLKLERSIGDIEAFIGHFDAYEGMNERLTVLATEQRRIKDDAQEAERVTEVDKLLTERLMTPATAKRAKEEKWSLVRIGKYRAEVEKGGPIVTIERVAPLQTVETPAAPASPASSTSTTPAAASTQERSSVDDLLEVVPGIATLRQAVTGPGSERMFLAQARDIYASRMDFEKQQRCINEINSRLVQERAAAAK